MEGINVGSTYITILPDAREFVPRLKAVLDGIKESIGIKLELDDTEAKARLDALNADLDRTGAKRETATVNVDTSQATSNMDKASGGLSKLLLTAGALSPALVPMTGVVAGFGAAALAGFTTAVGGIGLFKLAVDGTSAQAKQLKADFDTMLLSWQKSLEPVTGPVLRNALGLVPPLLTAIKPATVAAAQGVGDLVGQFKALEKSPVFHGFLSTFTADMRPALDALSSFTTGALSGLMSGFVQLQPLISLVTQGITALGPALASFGSSTALGDFIKFVVANGPTVLGLLTDIGHTFADIASAVAPLGAALVPVLDLFLNTFRTEVVPVIGTFAKALAGLLPIITPLAAVLGIFVHSLLEPLVPILAHIAGALLGALVTALDAVLPAIEQVIPPFATLVASTLPPLADLFGQLVQTLLPPLASLFDAVAVPVLHLAQAVFPILLGLLQAILPPIAQLIGSLLPPLAHLFDVLAVPISVLILGLLPPLVKVIEQLIPPVLQIVKDLLPPFIALATQLAGPLGALLDSLIPPLTVVIEVLGGIIVKVTAYFAAHKAILDAVVIALGLMFAPITTITLAVTALGANWSTVWDGMKSIFDTIWRAMKLAFEDVVNTILSVVEGLLGLASHLPFVGGKFKDAENAVKSFQQTLDAALGDANSQMQQTISQMSAFNAAAAAMGSSVRQVDAGAAAAGQQIFQTGTTGLKMQAAGGLVTTPTLSIVGEAGPELILPLNDPPRMAELLGMVANHSPDAFPMAPIPGALPMAPAMTPASSGSADLLAELRRVAQLLEENPDRITEGVGGELQRAAMTQARQAVLLARTGAR